MLLTRRGPVWCLCGLLAVALTGLGCSDDDEAPTEPEIEDPVEVATVTVSFAGSFGQEGIVCHDFVTVETGDIVMSLVEVQPLETLTIGLAFGVFDESVADTQCSLIAQDSSVRAGESLLSQSLAPDQYCVCALDVGNVFPDTTIDYVVEVTHP